MHLVSSLLRFFFKLLYHPFAWMYDFVAAVVSLGRWKDWVKSALPYLAGRVLEIGYGSGHLQVALHEGGFQAFGLDESRQMAHQASRRLHRKGFCDQLGCGYAQALPFPTNSFETVAATFPTEFIFDGQTLAEIWRVLVPGGRLVIVATAWITGKEVLDRLAAWLFKVTGQAGAINAVIPGMLRHIQASGFKVQHELVELAGSRVLVILASKPIVE